MRLEGAVWVIATGLCVSSRADPGSPFESELARLAGRGARQCGLPAAPAVGPGAGAKPASSRRARQIHLAERAPLRSSKVLGWSGQDRFYAKAAGGFPCLMSARSSPSTATALPEADSVITLRMELSSGESVVRAGTFLDDGQVVCDLRIVLSPVRFGTGDYEDPPEVSDDVDQDTFYIQYGSTTSRGVFNAGGGGFPTLSAAVAHVESMPGFGNTVRWIEAVPTDGSASRGS